MRKISKNENQGSSGNYQQSRAYGGVKKPETIRHLRGSNQLPGVYGPPSSVFTPLRARLAIRFCGSQVR